MVVAIPLISRMVSLMPPIAVTQSPVAAWIAATCPAISSLPSRAGWQDLDLGGDDGKPAARLAGTRGLDGRIQRQQVGLAGDRPDQAKHVADLSAAEARLLTISVVCPTLTTALSATWREWVT